MGWGRAPSVHALAACASSAKERAACRLTAPESAPPTPSPSSALSRLLPAVSSWVTSPLMGCGISYFVYSRIRSQLLLAASPLAAVRASLPLYYGGTAAAMALFLGLIGPKAYRLSYSSAAITAAVVFFGVYFAVRSPSRAMHATARATATGAASQPDDAAPDSVAIEDDRAEAGRASGGGDLADQRLHGRKRDSDGARGQGGAEDAQSDGAAATDSQGAASPSEASLLTAPDGNAAPSSARGRRGAAGKARGQRAGIFGGIVGAGGAREGKVDGGKDVGGASSSAPDEQKGATASLSISGAASPGGASDCGSPDADAGTAPSAGAAELEASEAEFVRLMVVTSCVLSFSHGSQDVSNAAAPYAAVVAVAAQQQLNAASAAPTWVLAAGGVGIVVGLATYGYKVMATVGTGITKLTFSKGFAAQLATALTALTATLLGLTVSTTHVMIGAIAGVALADGPDKLNTGMLKKIAASWIITLPASAGLAALAYGALSLAHTPSVPVLAA